MSTIFSIVAMESILCLNFYNFFTKILKMSNKLAGERVNIVVCIISCVSAYIMLSLVVIVFVSVLIVTVTVTVEILNL